MSKVYFETQQPSDNVTENRVEIGQVSALFQLKYCLGGVYSPPFTAYVVFFPFTGQRLTEKDCLDPTYVHIHVKNGHVQP